MIVVVDARNRRYFVADLAAMHCQRKAAFVDRAGWNLPVVANQEIDRYDLLHDTVYLLARDEPKGPVLASARLLATTGPHLMQDLYSASYRAALPTGPPVREVSRYCTAPGVEGKHKRLGLLWEMICGVMEAALHRGIDHVIFAANQALPPHALECGWEATVIGPTMGDGEDEITAIVARITAGGFRNVRERHSISESVLRIRTDTSTSELPRSTVAPNASTRI